MVHNSHFQFVFLTLLAASARADLTDLPLEALLSSEVVAASRFPQQVREAPSAVSVIRAEEIRAHGWRTLAQALASVRGIVPANDRAYNYIGPRGFLRPGDYNSNLLLLVDGVRINDNVYNAAYLGTEFPLDLELVERIEFVPGPGASIYGNSAFLGVVNVITRAGTDLEGGEAGLDLGSHGARRARLSVGGLERGRDWLLSISRASRRGENFHFPELDTPANNNGHAEDLDGEHNTRLYARYRDGGFSLTTLWSDRVKDNPTAPFDSLVNDPRSEIQDRHFHLAAGYAWELASRLDLNLLADYADYRMRNDSPGDRTTPGDTDLYRDRAHGRWLNLQARFTDSRFLNHKWVYGLEWQNDLDNRQKGVDTASGQPYADIDAKQRQYGLYAQDEWRLGADWRLNLGARYDHHGHYGGSFNPRLGLIQQLSPHTTLKYLAGSAYRAPNAYELAYDDAISGTQSMKANPDLRPQRIQSLEIVAEHQTESRWLYTASLHQYRIRDLINQITDPADGFLVYVNQDRIVARGLGLQLEKRWELGHHLRASAAWQEAEDSLGAQVSHSPRFTAKLTGSLSLGDWRLGLEGYHVGDRLTGAGNRAAAYNLFHLQLSLPGPGGEYSLRVNNLLDRAYDDPAGPQHSQTLIPQDGRTWEVRALWPL